MKIDHIAMYVNDLEAEKNFFVKYFNAKALHFSDFRNEFSYYVLKFEDESALIITSENSVDANKVRYRTGYHQIIISADTRKDVDDFMKKCDVEGIKVVRRAHNTNSGYYAAAVADPEGNEINIMALIELPF